MKRTTATNSVGGHYVDRVPGVTPGTILKDEDMNNFIEELSNPIELLGITLDGADQYQLEKAIIGLSKPVGEAFFMEIEEDPVAWGSARNNANPTNPQYFPAVKRWEADVTLDSTHHPLAVTKYRAVKSKTWSGSAWVTDHTVSVSGSTLTGSGNAWTNLLAALAEEVAVHGGYTTWMTVNVAGTDFDITNVNSGDGTLTVTGSPATGTQTAIVYPYRIAGSTTSARLYKIAGRVLMSPDGTLRVNGLRRRFHMQGHGHAVIGGSVLQQMVENNMPLPAATTTKGNFTGSVLNPVTDGVNGTPITGPETEPNSSTMFLYSWLGVLL